MTEYDTVFRARRLVTAAGEGSGCADFCVFAPDETFVVNPRRLHHKHPITPYDGRPLLGVVRSTWLRGEELAGDEPRGGLLTRGGT